MHMKKGSIWDFINFQTITTTVFFNTTLQVFKKKISWEYPKVCVNLQTDVR